MSAEVKHDASESDAADAAVETEPTAVLEETDEMYEMAADDSCSDPAPPDWSSLTVAALKAALVERGLMTTGRKADLVARLSGISHDGSGTEHTDDQDQTETVQHVDELSVNVGPVADGSSAAVLDESLGNAAGVETAEAEDEGTEVDEFVEWNEGEDIDHEVAVKGIEVVRIVDEVKGDDRKPDEEGVEEGDTKAEEGKELAVDVHRDKDLFYLTWNSKKITVPFKGEIVKDLEVFNKLQTVIIYPVTTADLYTDVMRKHIERATSLVVELEDMVPGKPNKGFLKMKFSSVVDSQAAIDDLKTFREGMTVKHFSREESEGHILTVLRKEEAPERKEPTLYRLMYVGSLPADTTEAALRELFPEALQVIIPCNQETSERRGYAYVEFCDEKTAGEMAEKYKDTELNGEKLYVIPAISDKKEKFGLLRDTLRLYWSEQTHRLQKVIDRPQGRPKWEVSDAEQKMVVLRRRLDKDKRRREALRLPLVDFVPKPEEPPAKIEKSRDDRERSSGGIRDRSRDRSRDQRSPRRERSGERRDRSPLPQRRSPPRNRRRQRKGPNTASRREDVADKLVNQLQGLVSALTNKLPTVEPVRPLLESLQFAGIPGFLDDRRGSLTSPSYGSNYPHGSSSGYSDSRRSPGYSSSNKRYGDRDDSYGGSDKRRRSSPYSNQPSSSGRYGDDRDRYGNRRDSSGSRNYNRSKF